MATNLERIRQMTADELAEVIFTKKELCNICVYRLYKTCENNLCTEGVKQWLEQESEG